MRGARTVREGASTRRLPHDYINESNMTMAATNDIMAVIMAAIGDTEVDFDDGETPEEKK